MEGLSLCRHNATSLSGHHQFLLRVNDEDARRRVRLGHVSIGLGICIAPGIKAEFHELQPLASRRPHRSGMLSHPVRKGQRIHAPGRCCWCADARCAQASSIAAIWNKRRYFGWNL